MGRFRLSIRGLILLTLVLGFDSAVMVRAYQHGRLAYATRGYLLTFGLILALLNLAGLKLATAIGRLPKGERLSQPASPLVILGVYLALLTLPILAILFYAPGQF